VRAISRPSPPSAFPKDEMLSEIFHTLSQPLTALECGMELSLRQDKTVKQLRTRMQTLLEITQLLHQRLLELRALRDQAY
jgi:small-conductance mechanosensitive channel